MNKVRTIIDVVEDGLGEELTESILSKPKKIDLKKRQHIARSYYEYEKSQDFQTPTVGSYEVFPYIHPGWHVAHKVGGYFADLSNDKSIKDVENQIKKLLLFYHKLALPSGFEYYSDYYRLGNGEPPIQVRDAFINHLRLYAKLRKLISKEIVFFIPEVPSFFPARDAVKKIRLPEEWEKKLDEIFGEVTTWDLHERIEQSLWIGKKFNLDLFLPGKEAISFFDDYSQLIKCQIPSSRTLEAAAGNLILDCQLPAIDKLTVDDIIAVRDGSDAFKSWRASLREVLESSYDDLLKGSFDPDELHRLADEKFASSRNAIESDIKKSSVLGLAKTGFRSIGIGLMTGVVTASIMANPLTVFTSSAASAGVTFLWDYVGALLNRSKNMKNVALKAHYAVWNSK